MSDRAVLRVAETIVEAFGERLYLSAAEIRRLLDDDEDLMTRCIDFLVARDELVLAADRSPRFYQRRNVTEAVAAELGKHRRGDRRGRSAAAVDVPLAITCDVLGWLEGEGRVRARNEGDEVFFADRLKAGSRRALTRARPRPSSTKRPSSRLHRCDPRSPASARIVGHHDEGLTRFSRAVPSRS